MTLTKKLQDLDGYKKKERERKQAERADTERKQELAKILESGQFPTSLSRLRKKDRPPLSVGNKRTVTYDPEKVEEILIEQQRAQGGAADYDTFESAKPPAKSTAPDKAHDPNAESVNSGYTFVQGKDMHFLPTKEVKAMRKFIDRHMTETPMMVCSVCRQQIAPMFEYEIGFQHLQGKHTRLFEDMMRQIRTAKKCPEDHEGMAARHGAGTRKLYCKRCRKLLYHPAKNAHGQNLILAKSA